MNCKNCNAPIEDDYIYCHQCGAKVIRNRITAKNLWNTIISQVFGWDNKYLQTFFTLILKPEVILKSYLSGTRKKYMAPFAFLAINTALSMLIFNQYHEKYIEIFDTINSAQYELIEDQMSSTEQIAELKKEKLVQIERSRSIQKFILKYLNILTFLMLPIYALIAYLSFGKRYNYGEHLVIVAYIHGLLFITSFAFFLLSIYLHPNFFTFSIFFTMLYYLYTYGRLYKYNIGKLLLATLKFLGIFILLVLAITIAMAAFFLAKKLFL